MERWATSYDGLSRLDRRLADSSARSFDCSAAALSLATALNLKLTGG